MIPSNVQHSISISLLTGGSDRPYVFGLATSLILQGLTLDLIGSDELDLLEFRRESKITFLNLRGSSDPNASPLAKTARILRYYAKLFLYAATAKPPIFHILWNNRFEIFDRTILMFYYRFLRKKVVLTVHNVNARRRDRSDTFLNRVTLRIQYHSANHVFVHTERMKTELVKEFGVRAAHITVIPFGINNSLPNTTLTPCEAKQKFGLSNKKKAILFFGRITPYKGLDYLIAAFRDLLKRHNEYCLIIAGRVDRCEAYWKALHTQIDAEVRNGNVLIKDSFVPDDEAEVYFKAADVLVLPYRDIYQSGVLFTGQHFGIPIIAADVGSFGEDIVEGRTGFLFRPGDANNLATTIERYFQSDLYGELSKRREDIHAHAAKLHSWDTVARMTKDVYSNLMQQASQTEIGTSSPDTLVATRANERECGFDEIAITNRNHH